MATPYLKGNNGLLLRPIEPEDLGKLYEWENDTTLWQFGSSIAPFSRYTLKRYIERAAESSFEEMGQLRLMIDLDGEAAGTVDFFDYDVFNSKAAIGLLIAPRFQHRGLGLECVDMLCRYAREVLLLHQVYAEIAVSNTACIRLFEKYGFKQTGIFKDWQKTLNGYVDVAVYQMISV